jgi:hypothetical protein
MYNLYIEYLDKKQNYKLNLQKYNESAYASVFLDALKADIVYWYYKGV